ncbi:MAG: hypothetical protein PHC81_05900 [Clostridia bacterium]|nr:hypothetical protein [Clostridia bacterium]
MQVFFLKKEYAPLSVEFFSKLCLQEGFHVAGHAVTLPKNEDNILPFKLSNGKKVVLLAIGVLPI